jgi:hypothetical protein
MFSTVPAAIDSLVAALKAADLPVRDGPEATDAAAPRLVTVGFVTTEDDQDAEGTTAIAGFSVGRLRERYSVRCLASARGGGGDIGAARRAAFDLLDGVAAVLAADKTLTGAVMSATVADVGLLQDQDDAGALASVPFSVYCDAYTGRQGT